MLFSESLVSLDTVVCLFFFRYNKCFHFYALGKEEAKKWKWIFWLYTLNSCLNPWIYMAFNPELVNTLFGGHFKRGGGGAVGGGGLRGGGGGGGAGGPIATSKAAADNANTARTVLTESQRSKKSGEKKSSLLLRRVHNRGNETPRSLRSPLTTDSPTAKLNRQQRVEETTAVMTHEAPDGAQKR